MNIGQLVVGLGVDDSDLKSSAKSLQQFGMEATKYLTIPITIAAGASFNTFKTYERTLAEITGLTGTTAAQTELWNKSMLELSSTIGKKPQELAEAMYYIASSGVEDAQAMDILTASATAAVAGLGEVQQVADVVTSALNAYGAENISAGQATDVLTAAVREGKLEADALSHVIGYAIPLGAELGVSFDQVAAAMAAMSTTGIEASTAATNLRQIFSDLLKPSRQTEQVLDRMGISLEGLQKMLREDGLLVTLDYLKKRTEEYGTSLAAIFPEVRSLTGALSLVGKHADANRIIFEKVRNSVGDTQKAYEAVAETLDQKYNVAVAELNKSMIALGAAFKTYAVEGLTIFTKALKGVTDWFNSLTETGRFVVMTITSLLAIVGPAALAIAALTKAFMFLNSTLIIVSGTLSKLFALVLANPYVAMGAAILFAIYRMMQFNKTAQETVDILDLPQWKQDELQIAKTNMEEMNRVLKEGNSLREEGLSTQKMSAQGLAEYNSRISGFLTSAMKYKKALSDEIKTFADEAYYIEEIASLKEKLTEKEQDWYTTHSKSGSEFLTRLKTQILMEQESYDLLVNKKRQYSELTGKIMQLQEILKKLPELEASKGSSEFISEEVLSTLEKVRQGEELAAKQTQLFGNEFDAVKYKTDLYTKSLGVLLQYLGVNNKMVQDLYSKLQKIKESAQDNIMSGLDKQIQIVNNRFTLFGDAISKNNELLDAYKNALGEFAKENITSGKNVDFLKQKVQELQMAVDTGKWQTIDMEEMLFGKSAETIGQRIEYIKDQLRDMVKTGFGDINQVITMWGMLQKYTAQLETANTGVEKFKDTHKRLNAELAEAQLQFDLTGDKLEFVQKKLSIMSDMWKAAKQGLLDNAGALEYYKGQITELNTELDKLNIKQQISTSVSQAFAQSMEAIGKSAATGGDAMQQLVGIILKSAQQIISQMLATAVAAMIMGETTKLSVWGLATAAIGIAAMIALYETATSNTSSVAAKMAGGGVVPPGYPNDTYPAFLTSGEMVTPPGKLPMNNITPMNINVTVKIDGYTKGKDLYYMLKEVDYEVQNNY